MASIRTLLSLASIGALCGGCAWKSPDAHVAREVGEENEGAPQEALEARAYDLLRMHDPSGRIPDRIREKEIAFVRTLPVRASAKSLTWTHQGPVNRGGRTRAFGVDISDPNVLLAGSATGGIWRSTDQGVTWTKTLAPAYIQNTSCLAQDPRAGHTATWYCGTGENYGVVSGTDFEGLLPGDGIFKSTDGGLSWTRLLSTVSNDPQVFDRAGAFKHVNSIVVDPVRMDSDIVVAAIFDGITRSNDGGATWHTVLGIDTSITATSLYTELKVSPTGVYYAAIGRSAPTKGVWRSTDGLNWTNITGTGYPANADRSVMAIDPSNENVVWCLTNIYGGSARHDHSLQRYTYLSGDGSGTGGQWDIKTANLPNDTCTGYFNFDFGYYKSQSGYDMAIAVHPTRSNTVFIAGTSVYRSDDAWSTPNNYKWIGGYKCNTVDPKDYVYPNHHPDQHWLEFAPNDTSRLYSTNDGGVHVSTDPYADTVTWTRLNTGYITSQFYTVNLEEGDATSPYILGGTQDNGAWLCVNSDPSADWKFVHGDDGAYCAIPEGRAFMLTSSNSGRLYKKNIDDNGNVLAYERIDPTGGGTSYNFVNQFVLDPASGNKVYWVAYNKLWRNNDLAGIPLTNNYYNTIATNWEMLSLGTMQRLVSLDISRADPNRMMLGTSNARAYRIDSLYTTPTKTDITSLDFPHASLTFHPYVSCVAPNDFNANEWLLTFSNYGIKSIFHTTDFGATWESVSGNLEQNPNGSGNGPAVFWAAIYPTWNGTDDRYFIGTSAGLFSTDHLNGDNTVWVMEDPDGIGNVPVDMITARGSDGLIAVGTHGSGIYISHLPAAPVGVIGTDAAFSIGNTWPNPATDAVNVDMNLPHGGRIDVDVFDLDGRTVLRRSLGDRTPGIALFTWDLRNAQGARVPRGTYVVHLSMANGGSKVVRVVVQ